MARVTRTTAVRQAVFGLAMSKGKQKRKKTAVRRAKRRAATEEMEKTERFRRVRARQAYELIYGTPVNSQSVRLVRPGRKTRPTKRAVIHEWDNWAALHPDDLNSPSAGMFFFTHLQKEKPELLSFRSSGDKWQTVHGWLLREARVKD
jgi:hypothetical protein